MPMRNNALAFFIWLAMEIDSCFKIGFVLRTHGLKGEVTISLDEDAPADFSTIPAVFLETDNRLVPYFIHSFSLQGKKAFVKFEDVDSIEDSSKLVSRKMFLQKSARPKSGRTQFYNDEIIDFKVTDEAMGALGNITDIMQAGSNRLLVIDSNGKELLIPVNSPFIISINKRKKTVTVNLPEGFLDI
jgi:16S rRNA processing protein RimM